MCLTAFGPHHSFPPEWRQATPRKGKDGKHDGRNTDKLQKQAHSGFSPIPAAWEKIDLLSLRSRSDDMGSIPGIVDLPIYFHNAESS
jgi:hypothetical protein